MLTQEQLKQIIHYDPKVGIFTWLERPLSFFGKARISKAWNAKYSGAQAGSEVRVGVNIYLNILIAGRLYRGHRLAWMYMYGSFPQYQIDHIDGNGLNNKIKNLRCCDASTNMKNTKITTRNKSGCMGVGWHGRTNTWYARLGVNRKTVSLGYFKNFDDAVTARKSAEKEYGFHENHGRIS